MSRRECVGALRVVALVIAGVLSQSACDSPSRAETRTPDEKSAAGPTSGLPGTIKAAEDAAAALAESSQRSMESTSAAGQRSDGTSER